MRCVLYLVFSAFFVAALSQKSPYVRRPVGYPELERPTTTVNPLGNRFGPGESATSTTQRLPIEALGDWELVNRISKLPVDKQPFWYINWRALEDLRKNHHTYEQRPSPFFDDPSSNVQNQIPNRQNSNQNIQLNQNGGNAAGF